MDNKDFSSGSIIKFLTESRYRYARHGTFLLGFSLLLGIGDFFGDFPMRIAFCAMGIVYLVFIILFYLNMYVLIPFLLFKGRYIVYLIVLILSVLIGLRVLGWFYGNYFDVYRFVMEERKQTLGNSKAIILLCVSLISLSTTLKIVQHWMKDRERIVELKELTYVMELNELRNQVSPHFLFNMLNNVKALIRTEPEMATTVIMKLSEFLRYQLYESNQDKVVLASEVNFISNFLNLEKIRKDNLTISFDCLLDSNQLRQILVPSSLFTVFVENAIKYSLDPDEKETWINISIHVEAKKLHFTCINSRNENFALFQNKSGGLGLANSKRRLDLIYSNQYSLTITEKTNSFGVNLIIPL
ncbi:sensor histidine kinase [Myroides odoratus]|uniref:sensor histidine kinase n=1 Tax=Myroides odoratus TaxID=256 RepID=UPI0039AF8BF0